MINLSEVYEALSVIDEGVDVKKFKPGSLGSVCTHSHDMIGSISIKYNHLSILVFHSGKIKISGGLQRYKNIAPESLREDILNKIIRPTLIKLFSIDSAFFEMVSCHFNVNIKRNTPITSYFSFIETIEKNNFIIKKPKIFFQTKQRGRICAVKIVSPQGGSMLVDHSGNIQAFAYKDYNYFLQEYNRLSEFL